MCEDGFVPDACYVKFNHHYHTGMPCNFLSHYTSHNLFDLESDLGHILDCILVGCGSTQWCYKYLNMRLDLMDKHKHHPEEDSRFDYSMHFGMEHSLDRFD